MEYQKYVNEKKELYDILLKFIENEDDTNDNFQNLINIIQTQKIMNNRQDFELFIFLLMEISRNHHRHQQFIDKINQIFLQFGSNIKQTFSNIEIYNYIKNNKLILLFFIDMKIIQIDKQIADLILENEQKYFSFYFYPNILELIDRQKRSEIELELTEFDSNILDYFSEKRKVGENDSYICSLIRQDSVEEFVSFINRTNISISKTKIKLSIFETNSFLIKNEPTLIEYSAFYGSIQIFNYLRFSKVELSPSLWIYAIHGRNAEIIHLLEENHVYPKDISYNECLKEAIKCHHNEIGQYIEDNLMNSNKYDEKVIKSIFHHCNYSYFPKDFNNKIVFYNLSNYNYLDLVNLYLKSKEKLSQNNVIKVIFFFFEFSNEISTFIFT